MAMMFGGKGAQAKVPDKVVEDQSDWTVEQRMQHPATKYAIDRIWRLLVGADVKVRCALPPSPRRRLHRVGPNCETWPNALAESPC